MYQTVHQYDLVQDNDMDDRNSIYLDTISLASDYAKLSASRQTIYHSTEDIPDSLAHGVYMNNGLHEDVDQIDGKQFGNNSINSESKRVEEVSARPLLSPSNKKSIVTYSQWKSRTWRRFQDGERSVDFILAYRGDDNNISNLDRRHKFETNLELEGLQLEREQTQKMHFIKIHAPNDVLKRYAEILKIKMPIKTVDEQDAILDTEFQLMQGMKSFFGRPFQFIKLDPNLFPEKKYQLSYEYSKNNNYLFDDNDPNFFDQSIRIQVVYFILERQHFSDDEETACADVGIEKLITDQVYQAAYPLHDGDNKCHGSQRSLLYKEWASVRKWIKHQPLDNIKDYFGPKVALYFAWLGFYTHMLIPASIVGIICFLYGVSQVFTNRISEDICNDKNPIIMCPQCDAKCDYWYLHETCIYSRVNHIIDNPMTVFYAVFMSVWAVLYLELWKRYSANIIHRWGLTDFSHQVEHPRPQYLARLRSTTRTKFNVVHRVLEPHVPFWKVKFPIYLINFSIILAFICMAVAAVFAVIIYRMSTMTSRNIFGNTDSMSYKIMVMPATAAVINLVVITILNFIYDYLAAYLTDLEYRRTQSEYDESLSLKIYMFQFINYYSSIFYIAFLKGKFVGYPAKYNKIFGLRQEECGPGGCLMELCIQLVIIMVGKQAMNAVLEMIIPFLMSTYAKIKTKIGFNKNNDENLIGCNQWTEDFKLLDWGGCKGLFNEYLEMVIQYGFITLFVVAFPLGPLFALINNIFEMRLDAKKFLIFLRRPVPQRTKHIGIWYNIMNVLGRLAVASSAFILAFSSNFIPRLVYMMSVNKANGGTDKGFLNHTLAYFDTQDFQNGTAPLSSAFGNVEICRYSEYRNPPWVDPPYKRPLEYWHIMAARLAFIVVFQNLVSFIQMIVAWAIPDTPRKLRDKIKREDYLKREIIIEREKERAGLPRLAGKFLNRFQNGTSNTDDEQISAPGVRNRFDKSNASTGSEAEHILMTNLTER